MEELLAEGTPYAALSVERIATRAGISRTAFYFYFADKRELLMRLASELSDEFYGEADAWWSGAGDGSQQLTAAVGKIATLYRAHSPLVCAIVEVVGLRRGRRAVLARARRALRGGQRAAHRDRDRGRPRRRRRSCRTRSSFSLVWMTERALYQMLVQDDPVCDDELVRALARIWTTTVYGSATRLAADASGSAARTPRSRGARRRTRRSPCRCATSASISVLAGVGPARAAGGRVQALELQDLEHVDEVDRREQRQHAEQRHDARPSRRRRWPLLSE